jgi:hypothetical protein
MALSSEKARKITKDESARKANSGDGEALGPYGQDPHPPFSGISDEHELQGISWSRGYSDMFELRLKDLGGAQPPPI